MMIVSLILKRKSHVCERVRTIRIFVIRVYVSLLTCMLFVCNLIFLSFIGVQMNMSPWRFCYERVKNAENHASIALNSGDCLM